MDKLLYKIYTYVVDTGSDAASRKMKLASSSPEHAYEQGRADVARVVAAIVRGANDPRYLRDLCECGHAQLFHNAFGLNAPRLVARVSSLHGQGSWRRRERDT